jgi:hypothetical protein
LTRRLFLYIYKKNFDAPWQFAREREQRERDGVPFSTGHPAGIRRPNPAASPNNLPTRRGAHGRAQSKRHGWRTRSASYRTYPSRHGHPPRPCARLPAVTPPLRPLFVPPRSTAAASARSAPAPSSFSPATTHCRSTSRSRALLALFPPRHCLPCPRHARLQCCATGQEPTPPLSTAQAPLARSLHFTRPRPHGKKSIPSLPFPTATRVAVLLASSPHFNALPPSFLYRPRTSLHFPLAYEAVTERRALPFSCSIAPHLFPSSSPARGSPSPAGT